MEKGSGDGSGTVTMVARIRRAYVRGHGQG